MIKKGLSNLAAIVLLLAHSAVASAARTNEPIQPIEAAKIQNPEKVELGKMLFFEVRLSKSGFISCNSCHNLATGGVDNLKSSFGHKWHVGPINSPTVLNSKYNIAQFWDGRAKDLKEQAGGPIQAPGEMASTHELAEKTIRNIPGYPPLFKKAFGTDHVSIDRIKEAIAAFEETLVTPNSRFDQWLAGKDSAITALEKKGYDLFKNKGCVSCHNGPAVGGTMYQKFGVVHPYTADTTTLGRYGVTKKPEDKFVFKVPTLRNIELTYPYFHDGSAQTLEEAIEVMAWHQLGMKLTKDETTAMVAFLKTLTGEQPQITLPILPPSSAKKL